VTEKSVRQSKAFNRARHGVALHHCIGAERPFSRQFHGRNTELAYPQLLTVQVHCHWQHSAGQ
jgi:hypothetical protein